MKAINVRWLLPSAIGIITMVLCQVHLIRFGDTSSTEQNCRRKCGDVNVPYPFGFTGDGEGCYREYFDLQCNETYNPPKVFNDDFEVLGISLESGQMRVLIHISYDCYNSSGYAGSRMWKLTLSSAFALSYTENVYTAVGCDTSAYIHGGGERKYTGGCISVCGDRNIVPNGSCSGIGCCQTSIPEGLRVYNTSLGSFYNHSGILDFNDCSYAFLVEKNNYTFHTNDLTYLDKERTFPIVWDWSISNQPCEEAKNSPDYACVSNNSYCLNSTNGEGYLCNCSRGYRGNPYLQDGCKDIDEFEEPNTYFCNGTCANVPGSYTCTCPNGTTGNPKTFGCTPIPITRNKNTSAVILVPVALCGGLFFVLVILGALFIFKRVKQQRKVIQRKRYFLENHGLLLQHLLSSSEDSTTNTKIFTMREIIKATNNFDDARIVGRGGHGIVYKGILSDLRVVAIKKSKTVLKSEIEEFINEVALLSQMNHRNIVKLFGCCLESEVSLLVYEFISNRTLADRLHVWDREFSMSWEERLRIASEVAGAVAYLHFSTSKSIFHRDLKSANILLDDKLTAKVSDFGASKFVMADQSHVTTVVQGTFGYLDPEYFHTGRLTDKSDVYSFGVILVELLTGEKPNSTSGSREGRNLTTHFLWVLNEKKLFQVIEPLLVNEATVQELEVVSELAESCLKLKGEEERPTMKDVDFILSGLMKNKRKQDAADNMNGRFHTEG